MPFAVAAQNIGAGPCRGGTCGDMLETMARIAPTQPNETMARISSQKWYYFTRPKLPGQNSRARFFGLDS